MKKILLICVFITCVIIAKAQTQDTLYNSKDLFASKNDTTVSLPKADVDASFPGGTQNYYKFLLKNLNFPADIRNSAIRGRVNIAFIVEKDGSLTNLKIEKSFCASADKEVLRLMRISPKWVPATVSGKPCRERYSLPISFSSGDDN